MEEIKYKQFVIVPRKPRMSAGKIASQVAHATFMALEKQASEKGAAVLVEDWKNSGQCVIVLECPTQLEMHGMAKYCEQWNIPHHLYIDEGFTEIPAGTATAFATGVLTEEQFIYFSQFKLFGKKWWKR